MARIKQWWSVTELREMVTNFDALAEAYTEAHKKARTNSAQLLKARVEELEAKWAAATDGKPKRMKAPATTPPSAS